MHGLRRIASGRLLHTGERCCGGEGAVHCACALLYVASLSAIPLIEETNKTIYNATPTFNTARDTTRA